MGCSELGFFLSLKHLEGIHEIVAVDIDVPTLEYYSCKTTPLTADFLHMREHELVVTVLAGSVCEFDKCLENSDAVVCIEL
jgi:membrane-bound inhibitor of C-type lysozyme